MFDQVYNIQQIFQIRVTASDQITHTGNCTVWFAHAVLTATVCVASTADAACKERITDLCLIGFSRDVFSNLSLGHEGTQSQGREHWHKHARPMYGCD